MKEIASSSSSSSSPNKLPWNSSEKQTYASDIILQQKHLILYELPHTKICYVFHLKKVNFFYPLNYRLSATILLSSHDFCNLTCPIYLSARVIIIIIITCKFSVEVCEQNNEIENELLLLLRVVEKGCNKKASHRQQKISWILKMSSLIPCVINSASLSIYFFLRE